VFRVLRLLADRPIGPSIAEYLFLFSVIAGLLTVAAVTLVDAAAGLFGTQAHAGQEMPRGSVAAPGE
jgi:hypothetical protein